MVLFENEVKAMGGGSNELAEYITQSLFFGEETLRSEGISPEIWDKYLSLGTKSIRKKGEFLVRTGENCHGLYFIKRGKVKNSIIGRDGAIKILGINGERTITLAQFVFHQQPGIFEAMVIEDSELYYFPKDVILQLMQRDFEFSLFITKTLAILSRMLATQIQDTVRHIQQSLARILYSVCCYEQKISKVTENNSIFMTHEELANMLGAHRVTVTKILNHLKQLGILDYKYEKIIILEKEKLKEIAFL